MNINSWFWLIFSLMFEVLGDVGTKRQTYWLALGAYNIMLYAWFKAVNSAENRIAIVGFIWLLGGVVAMLILGAGFYREPISNYQWIGIILGAIALCIMSF